MIYRQRTVVSILMRLGLTANYSGFHYILYAASLLLDDPERLQCIMKQVYFEVADKYNTSAKCVERNIRTVAVAAWHRNPDLLSEMADHTLTKAPSNSELLSILVTYILYC